MGQGSSTQQPPQINPRARQQGQRHRINQPAWMVGTPRDPRWRLSLQNGQNNREHLGTFRREVSARFSPASTDANATGSSPSEEEIIYAREERPFVNMEDLRMRDSTISDIAATPMARRRSYMSRLGSRLFPESVVSARFEGEVEESTEGEALRNGPRSRAGSLRSASPPRLRSRRHSTFGSLTAQTRRRSRRDSLTRDIDLSSYNGLDSDRLNVESSPDCPSQQPSWRRRTRERARQSLSHPLSLLNRSSGASGILRGSHGPLADTSPNPYLLPPVESVGTTLDLSTPSEGQPSHGPPVDPVIEPSPGGSASSIGQASTLRSRSSRLIRRDDQAPLPRVLQLVAQAIAAQLQPALPNIQPGPGSEGLEESLGNFLRTLQDAIPAATSNATNGDENGPQPSGPMPSMNFLRVFRYVNSERDPQTDDTPNRDEQANPGEEPQERTATLVVVGVRSIPAGQVGINETNRATGANLDEILSQPFLQSSNVLRPQGSGLLRRADGRSRFSSRRNSLGVLNYDSQRHQRTNSSGSRAGTGTLSPALSVESPRGPHPPPSTPADLGLSRQASGANTPINRPSSASAIPPASSLPNLEEDPLQTPPPESNEGENLFQSARQRRRSDSEYARHRDLGSGAARRNGVIGPDEPPRGGRSWLIYVVGTNLSEDHPAFNAPNSLWSDNPTYEDMILLSSLLGPAKPPVASQSDINSAGGLYRLRTYAGYSVAEALDGDESIAIAAEDRCLICQSNYEAEEELRRLIKCGHIYHRECIDEWMTTGRNSCPLCRGQGVDESSASPAAA